MSHKYPAAISVLLALGALGTVSCMPIQKSAFVPVTTAEEIVHGKSTNAHDELAWSVAALVAQSEGKQALCTGSILSSDTILTAAHCVEGNPEKLIILFGPNIKKSGFGGMRPATSYVQNPRWHQAGADGLGDLALVHFSGGLPMGYKPVRFVTEKLLLNKGTEVIFLGYGVTNGDSQSGAGQLRETKSTVIERPSSTQIMSDGRTHSVCFGDSGGPGFVKTESGYMQWGVASSVLNQECNEASVHTMIMPYKAWIAKEL